MTAYLDVHQHLWPAGFVAALRRRTEPPMLRGWTLHTAGEPPYEVDPADHDPARRRAQDAGATRVLVSLSSPLGIEHLPPDEAAPLLDAWHDGVRALGAPFGGWAALSVVEPDLDALKRHLTDAGLAGLQLPATALATPAGWERLAPALAVCAAADRPVLVHPGPARLPGGPAGPLARTPDWWPAVVDYPAQLQASWWAWREWQPAERASLRICFVAGAGLAPVGHERFAVRSGQRYAVDRDVFVETSSYGRQGIDALIRALGIDVLVHGSDRPYGHHRSLARHCPDLGAAALHAITVSNPARLLEGDHHDRRS